MLSCGYDLARLRLLRGYVDAVMIGANTVLVDNPRLVKRINPRSNRYYRIVIDGKLRLTPKYRVFTDKSSPTIVVTSLNAPNERVRAFREVGVDIVKVPETMDGLDLLAAMEILYREYSIEAVLVEGGGRLVYSLLRSRLADELRATLTPYVFAAGTSIVHDPLEKGFPTRDSGPRLRLVCHELCPCGNCVHVVYRVVDAKCCPTNIDIPACIANELRAIGPIKEA